MSFGQRLRQRREDLHMSRQELAHLLGVSVSAIGNYETGQNAVREDVLLRLFHVRFPVCGNIPPSLRPVNPADGIPGASAEEKYKKIYFAEDFTDFPRRNYCCRSGFILYYRETRESTKTNRGARR